MIAYAPAIVLIAGLSLGAIIYVGEEMLDLQILAGESAANTQERVQEKLTGRYEGTPSAIQGQPFILSEWTDDSVITGILVKCETGEQETIAMPANTTIRGGEKYGLPASVISAMEAAAGRCP